MIRNLAATIEYDQEKANELNRKKGIQQAYSIKELTLDNFSEICDVYASYSGIKEFLYIPDNKEILSTLTSENSSYVGIISEKNEILGLAKIEKLNGGGAFFAVPSFEKNSNMRFYGFSGLIVKSEYRKHGLGKILTATTGRVLHRMGAAGFYADCDFRNEKSFGTLSKTMSFLGFTDGRKGAPGEQTIYTTFYKSFSDDCVTYDNCGFSLDFYNANSLDDVADILKEKMKQYGGYNETKVGYGNGHNTIYSLKNKIDFTKEKASLILPRNQTLFENNNKLQNSNDSNIVVMLKKSQFER